MINTILINGVWEYFEDIDDIVKFIRENINYDLAIELEMLLPKHTDDDYYQLEELYNIESDKEVELEIENSLLKQKIVELQK